jgi:hypothetical protein
MAMRRVYIHWEEVKNGEDKVVGCMFETSPGQNHGLITYDSDVPHAIYAGRPMMVAKDEVDGERHVRVLFEDGDVKDVPLDKMTILTFLGRRVSQEPLGSQIVTEFWDNEDVRTRFRCYLLVTSDTLYSKSRRRKTTRLRRKSPEQAPH